MMNDIIDFISKARGRTPSPQKTADEKTSGRVNSKELREIFADVFEDDGRNAFALVR